MKWYLSHGKVTILSVLMIIGQAGVDFCDLRCPALMEALKFRLELRMN